MGKLARFCARHRHPQRAALLSFLLCFVTVAAVAILYPPHWSAIPKTPFYVLLGLAVMAAGYTPLLKVLMGRKTEYGFAWFTPFGIISILAAVFVHPLAVVPIVATSVTILHLAHKQTAHTWPVGLAGFVVPYTVAGVLVEELTSEATPFLTWVAVFSLALLVAELLNWSIVFPLSSMVHGEVRVPLINRQTVRPFVYLGVVTLVIGIVCYLFGIYVAAGVLCSFAIITHLLDRAIRDHYDFLGVRSPAWRTTTNALAFVDKLDEKTSRHALATARYTRDALIYWGFPKAAQELGFIAGFFHKAGLVGVADRLQVAQEELFHERPAIEEELQNTSMSWHEASMMLKRLNEPSPIELLIDKLLAGAPPASESTGEIQETQESSQHQNGVSWISARDVMALDLHPHQTSALFEGASIYEDLPKLIDRHHSLEPLKRHTHQDPQLADRIANMVKVAARYGSFIALDGSFPKHSPADAINRLRALEGDEFDSEALDVFVKMMNAQSDSYRNGSCLNYQQPKEQLARAFSAELPGLLDVKGWKQYRKKLRAHIKREKAASDESKKGDWVRPSWLQP